MTTTAATTSASPSTSNDSPIQDNNGASEQTIEQQPQVQQQQQQQQQQQSSKQPQNKSQQGANTSNDQKRPMNAFLLFCKRQRSLVREKNPTLENRGITKILGDYWSKLDTVQKSKYTDLARQHKEAFMKANPDFKWCKTPMSNNINNNNHNSTHHSSNSSSTNTNTNNNVNNVNNNNITNNNNINSNSNDCYTNNTTSATNNNINNSRHHHHHHATELSLQPSQIVDVNHQSSNYNSNNFSNRDKLANIRQQQHEAPKPPKKRFLERNDSIYTKNNIKPNEPTSHVKDGVVPHIILDQDTLDRVIDEAFSEKSDNNPSGINMCKCSNRISNTTNLTTSSSLGINPNSFSMPSISLSTTSSSTTTTTTSSSSSSNSYQAMSIDEPVDFSMSRTINATRQQIINNLVEKMLSEPSDNHASGTSKINCTDSVKSQTGHLAKRSNPEDT